MDKYEKETNGACLMYVATALWASLWFYSGLHGQEQENKTIKEYAGDVAISLSLGVMWPVVLPGLIVRLKTKETPNADK